MSDPGWQRMWDLFHEALEKPESDRNEFLDSACAGDERLRAEIGELLTTHERTGGVLDGAAGSQSVTPEDLEDPLVGKRIGTYRVLELIGEGGMGLVYFAEQEEPVRRDVALKLIRTGMDTREVVARFEAERQALAMMSHPAIARVFDAGATETGRPFFVMELVAGLPINEYCDAYRLSTRERLDLLLQVCAGVRHAHQRGLIHRDLKPSNVLVAVEDGKAAPKIIDFGVAKATGQRLTEKTMFTAAGAWIGTPEYMSPEQAAMTEDGIDTRTDVYSLGVLLYELLAGALPFDGLELRAAAFDEVRRIIREDEPPRPSTRVSSLAGESATAVAGRRKTDPASLSRRLSGDLDWIAMKALEKDPERRYGSVGELADDLRRHLRDEPVAAGPPSAVYRAGKFLRRHKAGASFASLLILFLATLAVLMTAQAGRIARERDRARVEAETSRQVSDFLVGLFEVSDPGEARGNSITAREVLDKGAEEVAAGLDDQPEVQARLLHTMGEVYRKLGLYSEAEPLLGQALELRSELLGADHPETLETLTQLGAVAWDREDYDTAVEHHREALASRRRVLGDDHPDTATSLDFLGVVRRAQGEHAEARALLEEALEIRRRTLGAEHEKTLVSMTNLAQVYGAMGQGDEALRLHQEVLEAKRRTLGEDHPSTLVSMNEVGVLFIRQGKLDDAGRHLQAAVEGDRRVLGDDHRETLTARANLAGVKARQGRLEEALKEMLAVLEADRRLLGSDAPTTILDLSDVGSFYSRMGRYAEAEPYWREALESNRRVRGIDHPETLTSIHNMGLLFRNLGRTMEAESYLRQAFEGRRRVLGEEHRRTLLTQASLGELLATVSRTDEAEDLLSAALATAQRVLHDQHVTRMEIAQRFGAFLRQQRRHDEAEPVLLEAWEIAVALGGEDDSRSRRIAGDLVTLYEAWGREAEAGRWRGRAVDGTGGGER